MAAAVTSVYLHRVATRRNHDARDEHRPFRLTPARVQDIKDVACGVEESDVGVCCSYLVDFNSGAGADYDEHALHDLERYVGAAVDFGDEVDPAGTLLKHPVVAAWRGRIQRTRRAFIALRNAGDHTSASALMAAHGYPDALARSLIDEMGEKLQDCPLSSLARYTEVVEEHRLYLAREEAAYRRPWNVLPGNVVNFTRHREGYERAERCISSGDALRSALAIFSEPSPAKVPSENPLLFEQRKAQRKERKEHHDQKRTAFLLRVKIDATRMLSRAERAWHTAWLSVM